MGKWINEPCGRKNLVVCQKMQNWSISSLQKTLLDARKFLTDSLKEEKNERINSFNDVKKELDNLKQNPVPIGFIYVQLPGQPEPNTLWSMVKWKDVTSDYAGLFFRAEGGNSAAFGQIQDENVPRIASANFSCILKPQADESRFKSSVNFNPGHVSLKTDLNVWSGHNSLCGLDIEISSGEVRVRTN
jgi:hypothetical protein